MSNFKNSCFDECEPKCPRLIVLEAVSLTPQNVAPLLAVPFDTNLVNLGNGILHTPGETNFSLVAKGVYRITFTGSVTSNGEGVTIVGVALAINGLIISGTTVTETVIAGTTAALATQTIVQVAPCFSTVVTVVNPTTSTETFTNPNIIIEKIG